MAETKINISNLEIGTIPTGIKLKNQEGYLHPETDIKRVQGLSNLVAEIEKSITASQSAATTEVAQGTGIVISSKVDTTSHSTTYTVALGTTLASGKNTAGIYKVAVDVYGRVTEIAVPTSAEVLALNTGTAAEQIANKAEVAQALADAKAALTKVAAGAGLTLGTTVDAAGSTTYTLSLPVQASLGSGKASGIYKTTVDQYGRVTDATAAKQEDILALGTHSTDSSKNIATQKDIDRLTTSISAIESLASQALHFQAVIDPDANLTITAANANDENSGLKKFKSGKTNIANGDVFVVGNVTSHSVTVNGQVLESGDTIIVQEDGGNITLHVVQANIDGAVTATENLTTGGIVVGKSGHTVEVKTPSELGIVQTEEDFDGAGKLIISSSDKNVEASNINIANVVTAPITTGSGVALINGTNITSAVSGSKGQVLGVTENGIEFVGATTKVALTGNSNKFELKTGASDADKADNVVSTIYVGSTADENVSITLNDGKLDVAHKTAGTVKTTVTSSGDIVNGGTISVPTISIDANGHVVSLSTATVNVSKFGVGTGISLDGTNFYLSTIARSTNASTEVNPNFTETFTAVSGVVTNANGQVTEVKTETVKIPALPDYKVVDVTAISTNDAYVKVAGVDAAGTKKVQISSIQIGTNTIKFSNGNTLTGEYYGGTAAKVKNDLTIAGKTYNGSAAVTISAGTGISFAGNDIALGTVLNFGENDGVAIATKLQEGSITKANGGPLTIPTYTVDTYGRVVEIGTQDIALPGVAVTVGGTAYTVPFDTAKGAGGSATIPFGTGIVTIGGSLCADLQYEVITD